MRRPDGVLGGKCESIVGIRPRLGADAPSLTRSPLRGWMRIPDRLSLLGFSGATVQDPILIEHGVIDDRPALGGEDDVDAAVADLEGLG